VRHSPDIRDNDYKAALIILSMFIDIYSHLHNKRVYIFWQNVLRTFKQRPKNLKWLFGKDAMTSRVERSRVFC